MSKTRTQLKAAGQAWCLALAVSLPARAESEAQGGTPESILSRAAAAEAAGRTNEAVAAYERLLSRDDSYNLIAAPRLVSLYAGAGNARDALALAARVAKRQPQPKPYLAGVYALLGQLTEAEHLLSEAARDARDPLQRAQLLWQLADVQERRGEPASAVATLEQAEASTADASLLATTEQRLRALKNRIASARTQAARGARAQLKAEEKP